MSFFISMSHIVSETKLNFYYFEAYFYFFLLIFRAAFVVFSLLFAKRSFASVSRIALEKGKLAQIFFIAGNFAKTNFLGN